MKGRSLAMPIEIASDPSWSALQTDEASAYNWSRATIPPPRGDIYRECLDVTAVRIDPNGTPEDGQVPPLPIPTADGVNLAAVLDGVRDAVIALDPEWQIGYLNAAAVQWLGGDPAD